MSVQKENKQKQEPMMEMRKSKSSYKIIVSESLEKKIRHLCQSISTIEWSGVLFYKKEGEFQDDTLVITAVDLVLLDIGTSTYTEFDMSPEVISYQVDNDLLDCEIGLIHSHNTMKTFFSGTDINTLREYGSQMNHFVSLIVNNEGIYSAAITRKVLIQDAVVRKILFNSFNDERKEDRASFTNEVEIIQYFDLKVEIEGGIPFDSLDKRIEELRKKVKKYPQAGGFQYQGYQGGYQGRIPFEGEEENPEVTGEVSTPNSQEEPEKEEKKEPVKLKKEVLDDMVAQLVTGSVTVRSGKINLNDWVEKNMNKVFERRFSAPEGLDFTEWAEFIVDFVVYDGVPDDTEDMNEDSIGVAKQLGDALRKFKKNPWIEAYLVVVDRLSELE